MPRYAPTARSAPSHGPAVQDPSAIAMTPRLEELSKRLGNAQVKSTMDRYQHPLGHMYERYRATKWDRYDAYLMDTLGSTAPSAVSPAWKSCLLYKEWLVEHPLVIEEGGFASTPQSILRRCLRNAHIKQDMPSYQNPGGAMYEQYREARWDRYDQYLLMNSIGIDSCMLYKEWIVKNPSDLTPGSGEYVAALVAETAQIRDYLSGLLRTLEKKGNKRQ